MKRTLEFSIKQLVVCVTAVLLFAINGSAQTKKSSPRGNQTSGYYLDITRPNCCNLTDERWQEIATALKAKRVPAFFGIYETLQYGESWKPVRLKRTVSNEGWLILGPFSSPAIALKVLQRLPNLLPNNYTDGEDERAGGVEAGPTRDSETWQIGLYQISGFRTEDPVQTQTPKVRQAGVIEGIVVEKIGGMNWFGIVIESAGVRYTIQLDGNSGGVETQTGDVETVGNRVRVAFKDKEKRSGGGYFLRATSVVEIKKR